MTLEVANLHTAGLTAPNLKPTVPGARLSSMGRRSKTTIRLSSLPAGVREATRLFGSGRFLDAFDLYEQLVAAYPEHSIDLLAELYDLYQALPNKEDRYTLYQARLFDFGIGPSDKVLDAGSGNIPFPLATHLADLSPDDDYYGRAGAPLKRVDGKPLYVCNIENLSCFGDKEFDFVYCSHVLEHVRDPERACSELSRIGKRGYVETPTRGKDLWLNTARISNHIWSVEFLQSRLVFTEYTPEEIEGLQSDLLMTMHVRPESKREKALTSLIYLKADVVNTMYLWEGELEGEVRRSAAVAPPSQKKFRPKTILPGLPEPQVSHQLKIYADRRYLPPGTKHTPLLVPLWGDIDKEGDPDWLRFKNYSLTGRDYFVESNLSEADIALLPGDWTHCQSEGHRLAEAVLGSSKPYVIFFINDSEEPVGIEDSIVFRTSARRSARRPNEFAVPAWSVDFKDHYFGGQVPVRQKQSKPTVGFCGFVPQAETNVRRIAINALNASGRVTTNFLLRSEFWAGALRNPVEGVRRARHEYASNIAASDYVLCVRGAGNFSYRLYETLSSGRIPVFVDTDCLLPFENDIDWKSHCVWVNTSDLSSIGEKVAEFHERLTPDEFIGRQLACRELWVKWLSPGGFFANFYRHFGAPKTATDPHQAAVREQDSDGHSRPPLSLRIAGPQPDRIDPAEESSPSPQGFDHAQAGIPSVGPSGSNLPDAPVEPDVCQAIRTVVQKGWTCVDVGANAGLITAVLAECVGPNGKVLAFEAHPENARALRENMKARGYASRVRVGNLAISDGSRSSIALYAGRRNSPCEWNIVGHDVDGNPTAPVLAVAAASLDTFFPKGPSPDLVKIDVEGAAGSVLAGMSRLLREVRPVLLIEFHDETEWKARGILFECNYDLCDLRGRQLDPQTDTQRLYHCLAFPSERSLKVEVAENPNTVSFYDKLYQGRFESNGISIDYQYEGPERAAWYQKVAAQPFFQCAGKILDVGCGNAGLLYQLPESLPLEKYGIDFSPVAVQAAKQRVKGDFRVGDVHHLPYADDFFDRVVSTETLEHVDDASAVVQEMARVLKPGGKLLITVPEKSLDMKASDWPGGIDLHVNKFSTSDVSNLVCSSHLLVESTHVDEREIWLTACKPNWRTATPIRFQFGQASKSFCLFVNTYYSSFLDRHYARDSALAHGSYSVQKDSLQRQLFGDCDFYSYGLQQAGWHAEDVIANCLPLQRTWARENGLADSAPATPDCLLEQIKRKKPDVVYLQDLSLATRDFLAAIRPFTGLIAGQIASPVPPEAHLGGLDLIVSSFPHFVERFRNQGTTAYYQPLAFDPRVLESLPKLSRRYPVTFVGGLSSVHGKGTAFLERLAELIPVDFWGYGAGSLNPASPIRQHHHGEAWGIHMFTRLSESFITVNRHIDVSENFANNMRLFEATGCGALLVTDYKDNLNELFEIGKEVVAYRSPEECAALIKYYLAHPDEAREIAWAGQQRTLREHTYTARMEQTAEILRRHLRYSSEKRTLPSPDLSMVSYGHTPIQPKDVNPRLTAAWQSKAIPLRQRALVQQELQRLYRGEVPPVFQVLADSVKPYVSNGCTVLETGCASGYYYEVLEYLTGKRIRYTGVDYSEPLISMARSYYPAARFEVADGAKLPFKDREFSMVVSGGVLLHVPNYSEHIAESCRVADKILVAHRTPVCRNSPTRYLKKYGYGVEMVELIFNEQEILALFSGNGMELVNSVETASNPHQDEYGVTYVFQKH